MHKKPAQSHLFTFLAFFLTLILAGCNLPAQVQKSLSTDGSGELSQSQPAMLTFQVTIPTPLASGDSIYLTLLDEVTGLAFNQHKYILHADNATHYSVSLPFDVGKVIKYRYSRQGESSVDEHLTNDLPVRYRIYHVEGPGAVHDVISRWTDTVYQGPTGRIMGKVTDKTTGKPVSNILVAAGGEQAFSLADGSFLLEGLPPATHNLVFYALDGMYDIFQQGAVVAADATTPVSVELQPARLVTVIFTVKVPADTPADAPIRMAGNLSQLGNTFADLSGGVSMLASRMPTLGKLADGRYMITLTLPAGAYLEYKYTLGDGLWSAEDTSEGGYRLRQMIVPDREASQEDVVDTWVQPEARLMRFDVKVPENTPKDESVSIQFNPGFGWLEPLPMWPVPGTLGQPVWRFYLAGPFFNRSSLRYRYCRQAQCGIADDAATIGVDPTGRVLDLTTQPSPVTDEVLSWAWFNGPPSPPNVPGVQIIPRNPGFIAGAAIQPAYQPSWNALLPTAVQDIQQLGVNWVILTPTWTFTNNTPPILEPSPAQDMLWPDLLGSIATAQSANLSVGLFPTPHFPDSASQWWLSAKRDYPWWVSFFERYSSFILNNADAASTTNANALILGGDWLQPALPGGILVDGSESGVPQDSEARWRELIAQVRARYTGTLAWALTYPDGVRNPPPFLDAVDQVYILWSAPLAIQPGTALGDMQAQAAATLDQEILPFQQAVGKPIILAIAYPSIDRAATGCIAVQGGGCLDYALLAPPNTDISALNLDLQTQADAYNAVLSAINERDWISGYVTIGYYPPAEMQDKSLSIHGKPAGGVLWYWSQKFLGH